jgi:hypothetical protein
MVFFDRTKNQWNRVIAPGARFTTRDGALAGVAEWFPFGGVELATCIAEDVEVDHGEDWKRG